MRRGPIVGRDQQLRASVPLCEVVRVVDSQPATREAHEAIVSLGFEGTVVKRRRSLYRAGRQTAWQKHKARHVASGTLLELREDRNGWLWAFCDVDGRRVVAAANGVAEHAVGGAVDIVYSRTDADDGLREARIARTPSAPTTSSESGHCATGKAVAGQP